MDDKHIGATALSIKPLVVVRTKHVALLKLGDAEILAAVTPDGTRLLSQRGVSNALRVNRGGAHWRRLRAEGGATMNLPPFLSAHNLREFVLQDEVLIRGLSKRIIFSGPCGRAEGIDATLLPRMCDVLLRARDANKLLPSQEKVAFAAELLMRALAHIGIISLVDEATGYQSDRAKDALELLLRKYISEELTRWSKTFSDDYYKELFRLRGLTYDEFSTRRPQYIGRLTNDIVYSRLAPKILDRLKEIVPRNSEGNMKHKMYYHLRDPGYLRLVEHLASVTTLMKLSPNWKHFYSSLNRVAPKLDGTLPLPFDIREDEE